MKIKKEKFNQTESVLLLDSIVQKKKYHHPNLFYSKKVSSNSKRFPLVQKGTNPECYDYNQKEPIQFDLEQDLFNSDSGSDFGRDYKRAGIKAWDGWSKASKTNIDR